VLRFDGVDDFYDLRNADRRLDRDEHILSRSQHAEPRRGEDRRPSTRRFFGMRRSNGARFTSLPFNRQ
jgi:hypothetical protein